MTKRLLMILLGLIILPLFFTQSGLGINGDTSHISCVVLNISEGGALVGYLDAIDEAEVQAEGVNLKLELPERLNFVMAEGEVMKFYTHHDIPAMGIKYTRVEEDWKEAMEHIVQGERR